MILNIPSMWLLANSYSANLTQQAASETELAEAVRDAFDIIWQRVIGDQSVVYQAIVQVSQTIALVAVVVFMVKWGRSLLESGGTSFDFANVVWPIVVAVFLSSNGQFIGGVTMLMRNVVIDFEDAVLAANVQQAFGSSISNAVGTRIGNAIGLAVGQASVPVAVGGMLAGCRSAPSPASCLAGPCSVVPGSNPAQRDCSTRGRGMLLVAADSLRQTGEPRYEPFAQKLEQVNTDMRSALNNEDIAGSDDPRGSVPPDVTRLMALSEQAGFLQFFTGSAQAFLWLIELVMFITALLGPIAFAASILSAGGQNAIIAWLTGFFSVAFAKIFYFILNGVVAIAVLAATEQVGPDAFIDVIVVGIFIGVFAPLLSLAVLVGGGRATFQSLTNFLGTPLSFGGKPGPTG